MLILTYPSKTWAHRLPAGGKLAALALATMGLFTLHSPAALVLAGLATLGLIASAGGGLIRASLRPIRMLWPFVAILAAWHLWLQDPMGITLILRMITAVALANFVTMTTRLEEMMTVLAWLLRPFARVIPPARCPDHPIYPSAPAARRRPWAGMARAQCIASALAHPARTDFVRVGRQRPCGRIPARKGRCGLKSSAKTVDAGDQAVRQAQN